MSRLLVPALAGRSAAAHVSLPCLPYLGHAEASAHVLLLSMCCCAQHTCLLLVLHTSLPQIPTHAATHALPAGPRAARRGHHGGAGGEIGRSDRGQPDCRHQV